MTHDASADGIGVPATYVRLLAREAPDAVSVLRSLGLSPDAGLDTERVPLRPFLDLVQRVDETLDRPGWHLDFVRRIADHFHGPLTFALVTAPTIGDGLDALARFLPIRVPYLQAETVRTDTRLTLVLETTRDLGTLRPLLVEMPLRTAHDYVAMLGAVDLAAARLRLAGASPDGEPYHERGFACPVQFAQPRDALEIPAAWAAIPNLQHDPEAWSGALERCETALAELEPGDLVARTRAWLSTTLSQRPEALRLEEAARSLNVSPRTLIRRLRGADTSFRALRDEARRAGALRLMASPGRTMEDVAQALGFSDGASFSRAFRAWFGEPPGRYRRLRARGESTLAG